MAPLMANHPFRDFQPRGPESRHVCIKRHPPGVELQTRPLASRSYGPLGVAPDSVGSDGMSERPLVSRMVLCQCTQSPRAKSVRRASVEGGRGSMRGIPCSAKLYPANVIARETRDIDAHALTSMATV